MSHSCLGFSGVDSPLAFCSSLRLSVTNALPEPLMKKLPANWFPPCLPMMFNCGPPVVASPRPPLRENTISCAVPTSGAYPETPMPW